MALYSVLTLAFVHPLSAQNIQEDIKQFQIRYDNISYLMNLGHGERRSGTSPLFFSPEPPRPVDIK